MVPLPPPSAGSGTPGPSQQWQCNVKTFPACKVSYTYIEYVGLPIYTIAVVLFIVTQKVISCKTYPAEQKCTYGSVSISLDSFMKPCLLAGPRSTAALDPVLLLVHRRSSRLLENRIHSGHTGHEHFETLLFHQHPFNFSLLRRVCNWGIKEK